MLWKSNPLFLSFKRLREIICSLRFIFSIVKLIFIDRFKLDYK
ncbi:hypothetical protein KCTC52924_01948 [Arenibacter antarcticus]